MTTMLKDFKSFFFLSYIGLSINIYYRHNICFFFFSTFRPDFLSNFHIIIQAKTFLYTKYILDDVDI